MITISSLGNPTNPTEQEGDNGELTSKNSSRYRDLLKQYNNLFLPVYDFLSTESRLGLAKEAFKKMQKLFDKGLSTIERNNFLRLLKPDAMEYNRIKGQHLGTTSVDSDGSDDLRIRLKRPGKSPYDQETVTQLFKECNSKPEAENKDSNKEEFHHLIGVYTRINLHLDFKRNESAAKDSQVTIANGDQRKGDLLRVKQVYEKMKQIAANDDRFKRTFDETMTPAQIEYRALWSQYNFPCTSIWTTLEECQKGENDYEESKLLYHELTVEFPRRHPEECPASHPMKFKSFSRTLTPQQKFENDLKIAFSSNFTLKQAITMQQLLTEFAEQHEELQTYVARVVFDTLERGFINPYNFEEVIGGYTDLVISRLEGIAKGNEGLETRVKQLKSPEMMEFQKLLQAYLKTKQTSISMRTIFDSEQDLEKFTQAHPQLKPHLDTVRSHVSLKEANRVSATSAKIKLKRRREVDIEE